MFSIGVLHGPWLPLVALVLVAVVIRRGKRPPAGELWLVGAITVCAAGARLICGLWGPVHANGQGPLWIRGALEPSALVEYGPGYFELLGWVARLGGAPDRAIFAANALLSALSPALLYATARLAGVARGGALAAAVVLAADAVSLRTAASDGYFSSLGLLLLGVQASLALGVRALLRRDRLAAGFAWGAACLLATSVARIHPVGYLPLAICPLVVLCGGRPKAWRPRIALAGLAAAAIGTTVLLSSGSTVMAVVRASPVSGRLLADLNPQHGELLLALLVAVWWLRRWARPPWLPIVGVFSLMLMLTTRNNLILSVQKLCYQYFFLPGVLLGVAPLLPRRLQSPGWALGSAAVIAVALLVPALPLLAHPTTEQLEYRFLQEVLPDMPPGCTLASVTRAGERVWAIPGYLLPGSSPEQSPYLKVERPSDLLDAVVSGGCLLYVRSSLCTSSEARALCESVEREVGLERVAGGVFPAAPSAGDLPYDRSEVDVVVFRVSGRGAGDTRGRPALGAGGAVTPAFAQALYDRLMPLQEADGCRVVRLDTKQSSVTVGLQVRSGEEHTLDLSPEPGDGGARRGGGGWVLAVPADLQRDCALTLAAIKDVLEAPPASNAR